MFKFTIERLKRRYVAEDLDLSVWENLESELKKLVKFEIVDGDSLEDFLYYWSELFMILQEQLAWKYIDMTRFADNEDKRLEYSRFYAEVYSRSEPYKIKLMNKYYCSPFRKDLD
ncbi:MAG: M3 family oligoendopeptidase, partial [Kosmotogaceae bacterium]